MKKQILGLHVLTLILMACVTFLPTRFEFLAWNVFLALIPYDLAVIIMALNNRPLTWLIKIPLTLAWLLFYPNTIYMITDFAHLSAIGVGLETDVQMLNYGLLAGGVFLGVALGLASAHIVAHSYLKQRSYALYLIFYAGLAWVASFGMYLGRYVRLNSWDLLTDFHLVIEEMQAAISGHSLFFVTVFTALQLGLLVLYDCLMGEH